MDGPAFAGQPGKGVDAQGDDDNYAKHDEGTLIVAKLPGVLLEDDDEEGKDDDDEEDALLGPSAAALAAA